MVPLIFQVPPITVHSTTLLTIFSIFSIPVTTCDYQFVLLNALTFLTPAPISLRSSNHQSVFSVYESVSVLKKKANIVLYLLIQFLPLVCMLRHFIQFINSWLLCYILDNSLCLYMCPNILLSFCLLYFSHFDTRFCLNLSLQKVIKIF